jgi:hypothetical protein
VSGCEQVRVFGGLGYHLGKRTQVEGGYLYRYERLRSGEYLSDHVIQVHLVFHTKAKGVLKPQVGDRYR